MSRSMVLPAFIASFALFSCSREPAGVQVPGELSPPPFRIILVCPAEYPLPPGMPAGMAYRMANGGRLDENARSSIFEAARDQAVVAVVVAPAPSGTVALFAELRKLRPALRLVAIAPSENALAIEAASDLVLELDTALLAWGSATVASDLGAKAIVSVDYEVASGAIPPSKALRTAALRAAAGLQGMEYISVELERAGSADEPSTVLSAISEAVAASGTDPSATRWSVAMTAGHRDLAVAAMEYALGAGMPYVEGEPPVSGYDGLAWDPLAYMGVAAARAASLGGSGKAMVWPWSRLEPLTAGILEHVRRVAAGESRIDDAQAITDAFAATWPAGALTAEWQLDAQTGVRARNHFLVCGDAYLVGRGYVPSARHGMPPAMRHLSAE